MIINTIFRMLWVTIALMLAVGAALAVLFALGAIGSAISFAPPHPMTPCCSRAPTASSALCCLPAP